jgi:hypothetical protein
MKLKGEIDHMRRMRIQTDDSQKKFEVILFNIKEKIETLMAESTAVIEERCKHFYCCCCCCCCC